MISSVAFSHDACLLHWECWHKAGVCRWYRYNLLCSGKSGIPGNKVLIFDREAFHRKDPKLLIIFVIWLMRKGQRGRHPPLSRESKEIIKELRETTLEQPTPWRQQRRMGWLTAGQAGLGHTDGRVMPCLPKILCQHPPSNSQHRYALTSISSPNSTVASPRTP